MGCMSNPQSGHILLMRFGHENIFTAIPLIQEVLLSVNSEVLLNCLEEDCLRTVWLDEVTVLH